MSARFKFSVMMFLEFFIWGAWLPLATSFLLKLEFTAGEISWIMSAFALASITAMFFSTQFADRNFAAERFLAFSHLIGGLAILALTFTPQVMEKWTDTYVLFGVELRARFIWFFGLMLVHSLFYVPTISITNSIAFANLRNPAYEFPQVRLWGTIGWIAASVPFVFVLVDWDSVPGIGEVFTIIPNPVESVTFVDWLSAVFHPLNSKQGPAYIDGVRYTYMAAGVASLLLAAFSLALPHTPPRPALHGEGRLAWLKAMKLLSKPFVLVLFVATFIDAAVHAGYFMLTGPYLLNEVEIPAQWIMPVMSIGQVAEIGTMAILGFVLKSLGWRTTMVIGILGHTARFAIFGFFAEPLPAILVNTLHGICYAFFFATVYIFVDEFFPKDVRSSAQGLFNFLILGLGPFVGNFVWSSLQAQYTFQVFAAMEVGGATDGPVIYRLLFQAPALTALAAAVLLVLFFHPPARADAEARPPG